MPRLRSALAVAGLSAVSLLACSRTFPGDDVGLLGQSRFACAEYDLGKRITVAQLDGTGDAVNAMTGSCGGESAPERVFVWTVPLSGLYRISTAGSEFDTVLYLFNGSCSADEVACSDDSGAAQTSSIDVEAEIGAEIVIVVDGANGESGSFELHIDPL